MGQIVGGAAKPKRCNISKLSQLGTPAAGEYILVSSDNSMNAAGQGNFDCYIEGDGTTAASGLDVILINKKEDDALFGSYEQAKIVKSYPAGTMVSNYHTYTNDFVEGDDYTAILTIVSANWTRFGFSKKETVSAIPDEDVLLILQANASTNVQFTAPSRTTYPYIVVGKPNSSNILEIRKEAKGSAGLVEHVGDVANLTTEAKTVVGAINELDTQKPDTTEVNEYLSEHFQQTHERTISYRTSLPAASFILRISKLKGNLPDYTIRFEGDNDASTIFMQNCLFDHDYVVNADLSTYDTLFIFKTKSAVENGDIAATDTDYIISLEKASTIKYDVSILQNRSLKNKTILMLGDSITQLPRTGSTTTGDGIVEYVAKMTGANVIRGAIGGAHMASRLSTLPASITSENEARAALDVVNIAKALATGDLTLQASAASYTGMDAYWPVVVQNLQNVDMRCVDIVTIFAGTNDCNSNVVIGNNDSANDMEYAGAMNKIVNVLLTAFPQLTIVFITPIVRYWATRSEATDATFSDTWTNTRGLKLTDYVEAVENVAKRNHVPSLNLYDGMAWTTYNFWQFFNDNDGTHPRKGFDALAAKIGDFLIANQNRW